MRGSDGGPFMRIPALPAFWIGLIYDQVSLDACWDLVKDWTATELQKLRDEVRRGWVCAEPSAVAACRVLRRSGWRLPGRDWNGARGAMRRGETRRSILS